MTKIAVLVSGGGTNLQALLDAPDLGGGKIELVVSSNPDAFALKRAENVGVRRVVLTKDDCPDRPSYDRRLIEILRQNDIGLVVLAGFMRVLGEGFCKAFENRIINVHPSLIPSFCGDGFYGLRVHEAALAKGVKVTGATVHFVNTVTDGGPIIAQRAVEILEDDTPQILQKRVMEQAEWKILPYAVKLFCEGKVKVINNKTLIRGGD